MTHRDDHRQHNPVTSFLVISGGGLSEFRSHSQIILQDEDMRTDILVLRVKLGECEACDLVGKEEWATVLRSDRHCNGLYSPNENKMKIRLTGGGGSRKTLLGRGGKMPLQHRQGSLRRPGLMEWGLGR